MGCEYGGWEDPENHSIFGQVHKVISRVQAERWLESEAAAMAGVERRTIPPASWIVELTKYRFLLSPMGDEIQSPKMTEALLVLTVPIVQRGPYTTHDDLVQLGWPIVVVDEWREVTSTNL